jgi:hypothetical protein
VSDKEIMPTQKEMETIYLEAKLNIPLDVAKYVVT